MSIINDALKKAGQPVAFPSAILTGKKRSLPWGPFLITSALLLIVSPLVTPLLHNPYRHDSLAVPDVNERPETNGSDMKQQFAMEETPAVPLPVQAPPLPAPVVPNFLLNGLVYSNKGSYCLINGKVLRVGESVDGARLVKVSAEQAVLEFEGREIILSANA